MTHDQIRDEIDEARMHHRGLECAIKGEGLAARPATDLLTTLRYALFCVEQRIAHLESLRGSA